MNKVLLFGVACVCLLPGVSCQSLPETPEARTLSALAPKVVFLCDFAIDFRPSPKMEASWRALVDPSLDTHNLIQLLKSPDPKIRSLAIFALDHKYDPRVLPDIATLLEDRAPSYPCPMPYAGSLPADKPETWPKEASTVGQLAREVVGRYMNEAGYTNFSDYWEAHKNREYCVSWYALRLRRAWGPRHLDRSSIDLLRSEIAHLPSPDREWSVLWLGTLPSPNNVVRPYSPDELIQNAAELGHEGMLQLLDSRIESTDPDLRARKDPVYWESLQALQTFVLRHSAQLLAATDGDFLLQEKFSRSVWYPVAAAQLDRKNASRILHTAYEGFNKQMDDYNRAVIVMAMWNLEGPRESKFILDWFYNASMGYGLYATPRHMFLRDAEEQESARRLIAALIRDPRFDKLEWNSLDDLVWMIRGWIGRDFAGFELGSREKSDDPRIRDAAMAECRRRIRATIPLWLHRGPSHISFLPQPETQRNGDGLDVGGT